MSGRVTAVRAGALGALAVLAYTGSVGNGFAYDDPYAVQANPVVTGEVPILSAFARDYWGRPAERTNGSYRPVALISLAIDGRVWGGSPLPFHATNVLLHAVVVIATYAVWRGLAGEGVAWAGSALLAVLAAPAEAVQAVVGRADLLVTLFAISGLAAHRTPGLGGAAAAVASLALALGSKESAIAAVPAWVAIDLLSPPAVPAWRRAGRLGWYAVVVVGWLAARHVAVGSVLARATDPIGNPLAASDLPSRLLGAARTIAHPYITGLLDPTQRLYDCSARACGPTGAGDWVAWVGVMLVLAAAASPILLRRRLPEAAAGLAWAGLLFLPASNLLFAGPTIYGERLLYAAAPGLCVALAAGVAALARRLSRPALAWAALGAFGVANAAAVQARHADWASSVTLFESGLEAAPASAKVQYNAAWAAVERGDLEAAESRARAALSLHDDYPEARALLAGVLDMTGRTAEAEAEFGKALAAGPPASDIVVHYATFLARHGRHAEALAAIRAQRARDPDDPRLRSLEARVLARMAPASP